MMLLIPNMFHMKCELVTFPSLHSHIDMPKGMCHCVMVVFSFSFAFSYSMGVSMVALVLSPFFPTGVLVMTLVVSHWAVASFLLPFFKISSPHSLAMCLAYCIGDRSVCCTHLCHHVQHPPLLPWPPHPPCPLPLW